MFNDLSNPFNYLRSRRSCRPRDMTAPGPSSPQLDEMLSIAMRTPDHGKLAPWRFIKVGDEQRGDFAELLERAFLSQNPDARPAQLEAATAMAHMAPALVILIHSPAKSAKIPEWEQVMSTGAVGMNLLHAGHIMGFVGGWITGWPTYDAAVKTHLCEPQESIAGFFYFGSPKEELTERPRPDMTDKISEFLKLP